jgi:hypothetical protein
LSIFPTRLLKSKTKKFALMRKHKAKVWSGQLRKSFSRNARKVEKLLKLTASCQGIMIKLLQWMMTSILGMVTLVSSSQLKLLSKDLLKPRVSYLITKISI